MNRCENPIYYYVSDIYPCGKKIWRQWGENIPPSFYTTLGVKLVPCGRCFDCRLSRARDWTIRAVMESKIYRLCYFFTLTYDDDHIGNNVVSRSDARHVRHALEQLDPDSNSFISAEYGADTHRAHYHGLFYTNRTDFGYSYHYDAKTGATHRTLSCLDIIWQKGFTEASQAEIGSIKYTTGYVLKKLKDDAPDGESVEFIIWPRGQKSLGLRYFNQNYELLKTRPFIYGFRERFRLPDSFIKRQKNIVSYNAFFDSKARLTPARLHVDALTRRADSRAARRPRLSAALTRHALGNHPHYY